MHLWRGQKVLWYYTFKAENMQFHFEARCLGLFELPSDFWCKSSGWQSSRDWSSYSHCGLRLNHLSQTLRRNDSWIVVESCWHDKCLCVSFSWSTEISVARKSYLALALNACILIKRKHGILRIAHFYSLHGSFILFIFIVGKCPPFDPSPDFYNIVQNPVQYLISGSSVICFLHAFTTCLAFSTLLLGVLPRVHLSGPVPDQYISQIWLLF